MQYAMSTDCRVWLTGRLKVISDCIVLEHKKPAFDQIRDFLQTEITWFRVILNKTDLARVRQFGRLNMLITVSGDFNFKPLEPVEDYTACMPEIVAKHIEFMDTPKSNKANHLMAENLLH